MPTRQGWRRAARIALRSVIALVSTSVVAIGAVAWSFQQGLTSELVTTDAVASPARPGAAFTALLVGLDARTDAAGNPLPQALLDAIHAGPDEGQLHTDTVILLHVPAGSDAAPVALSIPRDSFVPIAGGRGTHKINSAYGRGADDAEEILTAQGVTGAELDRRTREAGRAVLVQTVQNLTGVRIDHFAEINLAGFLELTEELGGVPVCLTAPASDRYAGIDLPAGPQTVQGASALAFVRQRHGLDGGDLDRIGRQQAFLSGLVQRMRNTGALTDPRKLGALASIVTRYVVLDRSWDVPQILDQLQTVDLRSLTLHTIPVGRPDLDTPVDGVAVQIDVPTVRAYSIALMSGRPVPGSLMSGRPVPGSLTTRAPVAPAAAPGLLPGPDTTPSSPAPPTSTTGAPPTSERVIAADSVPCVP